MPASGALHRIARFGVFEADLERGELRREGRPVPVQEHQLLVLAALLDKPGEEVSRQELRRRLWPDQEFLDFENGINTAVGRLRQVLGDSAENPRFIVTRRGHGYRFIAPVSWLPASSPEQSAPSLALSANTSLPPIPVPRKKPINRVLLFGAATAALGLVTLLTLWKWHSSRTAELAFRHGTVSDTENRLVVSAPVGEVLTGSFALSPSGTRIAFVTSGATSEESRLWLRSLDGIVTRRLRGTDGAAMPFWSPDERAIGFFAQGKLKTINLDTEAVAVLGDAMRARGGSWSKDGLILFAPGIDTPIFSIPATGGPVIQVTDLASAPSHRFPFFLADGRHFLYLVLREDRDQSEIWWGRVGGPEGKRLVAASSQAMLTLRGHIFFARGPALLAQAFDPAKLEVIGMPVVVSDNVGVYGEEGPTGLGTFSVSFSDTLATADLLRPALQLSWFDRQGRRLDTVGPPGDYRALDLSPDGTRVAVIRFDARKRSSDVSVIDLRSGVQTRITDDPFPDANIVWDPQGERLAFRSLREGQWRGVIRNQARPDDQPLPPMCGPESWFPDGKSLLCSTGEPIGLWRVPIGADQAATPLVLGLGVAQGRVSPDGSWLAYSSDHQERRKVFLLQTGSPQSDATVLGPGDSPRWRYDGRELFFLSRRTLMSVPVTGESRSLPGQPHALFEVPVLPRDSLNDFLGSFGVSPDGSSFLFLIMTAAEPRLGIQVVRHWNVSPPR